MDTLKTKSELESEKTAMEETLSILQTKDGAEVFIKGRTDILTGLAAKGKSPMSGKITMKDMITISLNALKRFPTQVVTEEIQAIDKRVAEVEREIRELEEELKPIEPIGEVKK